MKNKDLNQTGLKLENIPAKIKANGSNILKGIAKIVTNATTKNYTELPGNVIDTLLDSFEFKKTPESLGWQLICRALVKALLQLLSETRYRYEEKDIETGQLDTQLNEILADKDYYLPLDFFQHPRNLPFLEEIEPVLKDYLGCFGLEKDEISNILIRFNTLFVLGLRKEWVENSDYYKPLEEKIQSPFDSAVRKEIAWEKYYITLEEQIAAPVFSERFCLEQIYIPLRACYKEKQLKSNCENVGRIDRNELQKEEKDVKEIIVDIESHISDWIEKGNQEDSIRIIHGGPGSGKSSFLKILAAKLARKKQKVLYIPLHEYGVNDNFTTAVNQYFRKTGYFSYDLISDDEKEKLVILFDGLDEISMQGKALEDIVKSFVWDVIRNTPLHNKNGLRIQVIIAGRDVIVQRNENEFKHSGEILRLLPYLIQEKEKKFIDQHKLFENDQRNEWWIKYGNLKNKPYNDGLPAELKQKGNEIEEITAQPLLNYLIALALEYREEEDTQVDFDNINTIYSRLLKGVHKREYSSQNIASGLEFDNFVTALKEIALCTWHGNGRTTTANKIEEYLKDQKLFEVFSTSAEKGVISLLTTFYFRQTGRLSKGEETFEFTHKSFSEYLVTLKIIEVVDNIHEELVRNENDRTHQKGWDIYKCLIEWLKVFGLQVPDEDLVKYIKNELRLKEKDSEGILNKWQDTIIKLWEHVLEKGMPVEQLPSRPQTFKEENEQAINAEKTLLIIHGLIASITDRVSDIKWPQLTSFGEFIGRILGQRIFADVFILKFCNHLKINNAILDIRDFFEANLEKSDLSGSTLTCANLYDTNLNRTNFSKSNISYANLSHANISKANLSHAKLIQTNLRDANLRDANLRGANLANVDLSGADFSNADLSGAIVKGVDLSKANFSGANLTGIIE